jgi:protein-tyrosine phosphatase/membrane-associated phospholipid phosphatase
MSEAAPRPWRRALAWLALLAPLFFLTYGWANGYAAALPFVPNAMSDWERAIPFWAWSIVPYWSIDAFYAASLFVCDDRRELDRHASRLLSAQAIAIACFVAFPLRLAFARPQIDGVFGWMFDVLHSFDQPFNQAPSLHIVLLVLLWLRFGAHLRGGWRWVLHVWAVLIGISVLTTWQHHFIDVPTGLLTGFFCAWLWPMRVPPPWREAQWARDAARWRLAAIYGLGALFCAVPAWTLRGAAWWLAWPAVSLGLVAANYAVVGPNGFQKDADGRMSVAARWLYAPYLLGAALNAWAWTRRAAAPVEVLDGVWLGRLPPVREAGRFAALVDVCAELPAPSKARVVAVPMLDLVMPTQDQLAAATRAVEAVRGEGAVLVCCALGYSRSALVVAAWLLATQRADSPEQAIARVRAAKPGVVLRERHHEMLRRDWPSSPLSPASAGRNVA